MIWVAIAFNAAAIALMATWPRPNHVDDMREMFSISDGTVSQFRHRFRRWRKKLPPAARVTTLVIQRAFGPLLLAVLLATLALGVTAYFYPDEQLSIGARATAILSNTVERLSQGAIALPDAKPLTPQDLPTRALLASFTFVITVGLVRIIQQWLLSIVRTFVCIAFREGSYEALSGGVRNRPRLSAVLGVQRNFTKQAN